MCDVEGGCVLRDGFDRHGRATDQLTQISEVISGDLGDTAVLACLGCDANLFGVRTENHVTERVLVISKHVLPENALAAHPDRISA